MPTTWNPADKTSGAVLSNGNLSVQNFWGDGTFAAARATLGRSSGKCQIDFIRTSGSTSGFDGGDHIGFATGGRSLTAGAVGNDAQSMGQFFGSRDMFVEATAIDRLLGPPHFGSASTYVGVDVGQRQSWIIDLDAKKLVVYNNGQPEADGAHGLQDAATMANAWSYTSSGPLFPAVNISRNQTFTIDGNPPVLYGGALPWDGSAAVNGSATGCALTETFSLAAGAASAAANGNAAGAAVTIAHSLAAGAASGWANAPGAALGGMRSLIAGTASGAAAAVGAAATETLSLAAGPASAGATASGAALTQGLSLAGSAAKGAAAANGAALVQTLSLTPGAASAAGTGSASGANLTLVHGLDAGHVSAAASAPGAALAETLAVDGGAANTGTAASGCALTITLGASGGTASGAAASNGCALAVTFGITAGSASVGTFTTLTPARRTDVVSRADRIDAIARAPRVAVVSRARRTG